MLFGLPTPQRRQLEGMNCIGPTARSQTVSPSSTPWSVSGIAAIPGDPSSRGPRIGPRVLPAAFTRPSLAWPDSIRPIPARIDHDRLQPGWVAANVRAARS